MSTAETTAAETTAASGETDATHLDEPKRSRFGQLPVHLSLLIIGLIIAVPIIIAFFMSFTPLPEIVGRSNPSILPDTWTLDNYDKAWRASPFPRYMLNSFIQTGVITAAQVLFSILAGYAFAMFEFRGKNVLFAIVIGSLIIPFELTFIPNFLLISELGLANTYAGADHPVPGKRVRGVHDAAVLHVHPARPLRRREDRRCLRLVLPVAGHGAPVSKGAIAAFTIFAFLSAWNQYLWPLVITNEENRCEPPRSGSASSS